LDENAYSSVPAITGFIQQEPNEGQPTTERTDAWLFFDDENIYVAARCWDSEPDRQIANEMRRDGQSTNDNESFAVEFDTFHDRRNAFLFQTTLAGGLFDAYITDERDMNRDWNTVWDARSDRTEDGYTVEMVIPFKSLRFRAGEQVWGVNFKRVIRWKNEMIYLTAIPAALGRRGMNKVSSAATLVGLETPKSGHNVEIKPYGISGLTTLQPTGAASNTDPDADAGFDVKVGLTDGLTADITYNTDFAQVEEDEQQVNLTRFNLIFPEKREFFLEGQGIFSFGGVQGQPRGGGGGGGGAAGQTQGNPNPVDIPVLFFSRRIGLSELGPVPIDIGGRVSGKAGRYSIGLIDIRTGDEPAFGVQPTNFGVVRIKRDILRRSAVGVLFTDRSISSNHAGRAQSFGADGVFSFYQNLNFNTYIAKTALAGSSSDSLSYRAQLDYNADRYGVQVERVLADRNFNPEVGFMRRLAFQRDSAYLRFSPRPASIPAVRKFVWDVAYDYITSPSGHLESRLGQVAFRTELQNGDAVGVEYALNYESIERPFLLSSQVVVPVGDYSWPEVHLGYNFGPSRRASGFVNLETGSFYDGKRTGISTGRARVEITPQLSVEPTITVNWVDLPTGSFTTALLSTRTTFSISPRMSAAALLQYNSDAATFNTNVRFRWEYRPGSDFFVVYTDNRDTTVRGFPEIRNRGFVVKLTRLFRL
jgi:Domain of unknown function (DUF5916)